MVDYLVDNADDGGGGGDGDDGGVGVPRHRLPLVGLSIEGLVVSGQRRG